MPGKVSGAISAALTLVQLGSCRGSTIEPGGSIQNIDISTIEFSDFLLSSREYRRALLTLVLVSGEEDQILRI